MTSPLADDRPAARSIWPFGLCFALLVVGIAAMRWGGAQGERWPWMVLAGFFSCAVLAVAWRIFPMGRVSVSTVVLAAVLLRVLMFPLGDELSDDYHRYQWDGALVREGINPYQYRPGEMAADHPFASVGEHRTWFVAMNSPDYYSIYPPLSQFAFAAAGGGGGGYWALKALFAVAELGALLLLARMVDARRLLLYAWNPLLILETWGQPHTEALALLCLAGALWFWRRRSPLAATAALTLATWIKLFPLLLLPFLWRRMAQGRERWQSILLAAVLSAAIWLPFFSLEALANIYESTHLYMLSFEFNAGPYYLLKWLSTVPLRAIGWLGENQDTSKVIGPLMRAVFLCGVLWLWRADREKNNPFPQIVANFVGLFLLSFVNLHPWYLTFAVLMMPWMSKTHAAAWLWLSACSIGTYLSYSHGIYWPFVVVGWGGFAVIAMVGIIRSGRSATSVPPPATVREHSPR